MVNRTERTVLHSEPDFDFSFDEFHFDDDRVMPMIHLDVFYFDKNTMKRLREVYDYWRPKFPPIIFAQPEEDTPLFEKFVSRFGFKFISDAVCSDGATRRIFVNYR